MRAVDKLSKYDLMFLIEWATSDVAGASSTALCRYMLGFDATDWGYIAPSDESDRRRCIRLLNLFPDWWNRLDELSKYSDWKEQIPLIKKEKQLFYKKNSK